MGSADKMKNGRMVQHLIPWHAGRALVWDETVSASLAESYVDRAVTGAGLVAEMAAEGSNQIKSHLFVSVASIARFHSAHR